MTKHFLIALSMAAWPIVAFAASATPTQTGAFLGYCKTNSQGCIDKVTEIKFAVMITQPISHKACLTADSDNAKALTSSALMHSSTST